MDAPSPKSKSSRNGIFYLLGVLSTLMALWLIGSSAVWQSSDNASSDEAAPTEAEPDSTPRVAVQIVDAGSRIQLSNWAFVPSSAKPLALAPVADSGAPIEVALDQAPGEIPSVAPIAPVIEPIEVVMPFTLDSKVVIKLATVAPKDSHWDKALRELATQWKVISNGTVTLKIFAGGTQGDEGDEVKKMRVGQLQAAALSNIGLLDISPEPGVFSVPGLVRSSSEFQDVLHFVRPGLDAALVQNGFVALAWVDMGPVYFFTKDPAPSLAALQPQPILAWSGNLRFAQLWKELGLTPTYLSSTDTVTALQTGMIKSFANGAEFTSSIGWYKHAPHMTDFEWSRQSAAIVVEASVWAKIPPPAQAALLAVARRIEAKLASDPHQTMAAISAMKADGLEVVEPNAEQAKVWQEAAERTWSDIRGKFVSAELFDAVQGELARIRIATH